MATVALLVGGLALFVIGAELLLVGVSLLARTLRIPTLVVGLTVVPFATSTPELIVSFNAVAVGQVELAVGNVVGTNTFNVLLILGMLALVAPLRVSASLVRTEVPIMIGVSVLLLALAYDGRVGRVGGLLLLVVMVGHVAYLLRAAGRSDPAGAPRGSVPDAWGTTKGGALVILGGTVLALSAQTVVGTATDMATQLGMSPYAMGLMFVSVGTSLPELATTIVAVARGEHDLAVGNVVGSNIFNILTILGITAIVSPAGLEVPEVMVRLDLPVMIAAAAVCFPIVLSGRMIDRWEGALLLVYYGAYMAYGRLYATDFSPSFTHAVLYLVLPLTALTVVVIGWAGLRRRARSPKR